MSDWAVADNLEQRSCYNRVDHALPAPVLIDQHRAQHITVPQFNCCIACTTLLSAMRTQDLRQVIVICRLNGLAAFSVITVHTIASYLGRS